MIRNVSAELYADLLDGKVVGSGPQLNSIGVRTVVFGDWQPGRLNDIMEFWPLDKPLGPRASSPTARSVRTTTSGISRLRPTNPSTKLAAIAAKHKVEIVEEERGLPHLVPVIYDHEGNFVEFFSESDRLPTSRRSDS